MRIARRFNAGMMGEDAPVPKGRLKVILTLAGSARKKKLSPQITQNPQKEKIFGRLATSLGR